MNPDEPHDAILAKMQAAAATEYASRKGLAGSEAMLSPQLITTIVTIAMNLLKSCMGGNSGLGGAAVLKSRAQNPGLFARFRVRRTTSSALAEQFGPGGWMLHDGEVVMDSVLAMGANASVEDIASALQVEN